MFKAILSVSVFLVLSACADRSIAPIVPQAAKTGNVVPVYVATNRAKNEAGYYDNLRGEQTTFLASKVSLPPGRALGEAPIYRANPNPNEHFALASQTEFAGEAAFIRDVRRSLASLPKKNREVVLYVHGYYNGYADTVFRVAQMKADFGLPGAAMVFSWPSAGHPAGYTYDRESALFARDSLEQTLFLLQKTGADVLIAAHSMGGLLVMETLRQIEIARPGWSKANIDGVALLSPDIAVDVFHQQASRIKALPEPFIVVTSEHDRALKLSTRVNNNDRLGLGGDARLAELPITFLDVSDFSEDSGNTHFVLLESPALIAMLEGSSLQATFENSQTRSILDQISETRLNANQAVVVELSPEADLGGEK